MKRCNEEYVNMLMNNDVGEYWDGLDLSDLNNKATKSYVTINGVNYTVDGSNIRFDFNVKLSRALSTSFFNPPNGSYFMKTRGLSKGTNKYSFTVPI